MIVVRRYHLALTHAYGIGTQACMDEDEDGFYVQHSEHLAEVRQTQRRMIAALYWRAGVLSAGGYLVPAVHIISMAQDMEATCAR